MAVETDIKDAKETYVSFVGLVKWGTIVTVLIAATVVLIIS
ncbi:MAG: aa3-type cytochrome c oxidase subunit IV [Sphingobium sp.]